MLGKDIQIEEKDKSQEAVAKKVIEDIRDVVDKAKEEFEVAERKLEEVLKKDINDIKKEDAHSWDW